MEYSIVTNLRDGRQLTGSGYTNMAAVKHHMDERRRHYPTPAELHSLVVVRADGEVCVFTPDPRDVRLMYGNTQKFQQWYADEKAAAARSE